MFSPEMERRIVDALETIAAAQKCLAENSDQQLALGQNSVALQLAGARQASEVADSIKAMLGYEEDEE